jgi:hypothetical protein
MGRYGLALQHSRVMSFSLLRSLVDFTTVLLLVKHDIVLV